MDTDDFESELIRIGDWLIANEPDARRANTTIADDAIALLTRQQETIAKLDAQLATLPHGGGKTHTVDWMLMRASGEWVD